MASFISTVKAPLTPCSDSQRILSTLRCHGNLRFWLRITHQVLRGDGLSIAAGGHDHLGQTLPHVLQAAGEGEDGHDFTGHRDVKLSLQDGESRADQQGGVMKRGESYLYWLKKYCQIRKVQVNVIDVCLHF